MTQAAAIHPLSLIRAKRLHAQFGIIAYSIDDPYRHLLTCKNLCMRKKTMEFYPSTPLWPKKVP